MAVPRSTLEQAHRLVHFASTAADEGPPMQVPAEINADDLIMFVRASGRTITRDQINRWQRKGLLPPSRQRGLGRGLGSETIFPIVAVPQTEALHDALKLGRNFDDVGWRLWWLGFPVEDRYWRTRASHWATEWDRVLKAVRLLTGDRLTDRGDDLAAARVERIVEFLYATKDAPPLLRHLRKGLGRRRFGEFARVIARMATGTFKDGQVDTARANSDEIADAKLIDAGLGFADARKTCPFNGQPWLSGDITGPLAQVSKALGGGGLGATFADSAESEIEECRDQLRRLFATIGAFCYVVDRQWTFPAFGLRLVCKMFESQTPDYQAGFLVAWLRLRPVLSEGAERFISEHEGTRELAELLHSGAKTAETTRIQSTTSVFPYGRTEIP